MGEVEVPDLEAQFGGEFAEAVLCRGGGVSDRYCCCEGG